VDELIAAQARKLDALKTHKKGLMQQLFPREGETQPRLRFPEFQNAGEWVEATLGAACRMQAGKFVSASDIREKNAEGLFPCYGGNGLRGYTATFTHSGKYPLIGRQGALCGNVKLGLGQFHATEHAVVVTPKNDVAVDWLFYLLDFLNLNQYATGQAQPGLSVDVLEKVPVSIPNQAAEQQRIADCLTNLDDLIAAQTQTLEALKTHKQGLMQQLFPSPEAVAV
jgi:type I restriction enzyme, S subunit